MHRETGVCATDAQVRVPRAAAVKGKVAVHLSGLEADINVLRRLKHPNIVRYLVRRPPLCSRKRDQVQDIRALGVGVRDLLPGPDRIGPSRLCRICRFNMHSLSG